MEDKQKKLDACFDLFNLDERASQRELEIAYEVITKDKKDTQLRVYRLAFEFLMTNFYKAVDVKPDSDVLQEEDIEDFDKEAKICINTAPKPVRDAIEFANKDGITLSDATTLAWATQNINLPILYHKICTTCHKFFGLRWWTKNDIIEIIKTCVLNPLEYRTCTFELSATSSFQTEEIQQFVKSLQDLYAEDTFLCTRFDIRNTKNGTMGFVVVERGLREHLVNMLHTKALQSYLTLNLVTPEE